MINYTGSEEILSEQKKMKKLQNSNTSDKLHTSKTLLKMKYMPRIEQHGTVMEKTNKDILPDKQLSVTMTQSV